MDCRVKPGNDDGWVRVALESRTPLRFRGNDGRVWTGSIEPNPSGESRGASGARSTAAGHPTHERGLGTGRARLAPSRVPWPGTVGIAPYFFLSIAASPSEW